MSAIWDDSTLDIPIPGNPTRLEELAAHLGDVASSITEQGERLSLLDPSAIWQGDAYEAAIKRRDELPPDLDRASDRYQAAAGAVMTYACELRAAQQEAEAAVESGRLAELDLDAAEAGLRSMEDWATSVEEAFHRHAAAGTSTPFDAQPWLGPDYDQMYDDAQNRLAQAGSDLQAAYERRDLAAQECEVRLDAASDDELVNSGPFSDFVNGFTDLFPGAATGQPVGLGELFLPSGTEVATFPIPIWDGYGTTRIQYFIDDGRTCALDPPGPGALACGWGDDREFASGDEIKDYNLPARVRVILDHDQGVATVVSYPTHGDEGTSSNDALPVELDLDPEEDSAINYPSQVRVEQGTEPNDARISFDYNFVNSLTPSWAGDIAPAITGGMNLYQEPNGKVRLSGAFAQYPSVEIIRDRPTPDGASSELIYTKKQDDGGPSKLMLPREGFEATG